MSLTTLLPWATTLMGASIMYLAGRARTRRLAWALGVLNQVLWCAYAVVTGTWGFVAGSLIYGSVYVRNLTREVNSANRSGSAGA